MCSVNQISVVLCSETLIFSSFAFESLFSFLVNIVLSTRKT